MIAIGSEEIDKLPPLGKTVKCWNAEIGGYDPVELGYLLLKIKDGQIEALDRIVI